ncbi:CRTAC1 family protein [Wenzhouxiangella sediminis]|uniref:CRTAC1 family protein n=1 Tax=Wenzhouxiangella sediminis TaxID=1792836 RepID=A0A3E1K9D2_9GAMM|nr:CRTAC1 family protein [Wenzhouxiangella sediminis]RFF30709.1 CRTAC1 family protein [Wenzhouxiangella sediminis]
MNKHDTGFEEESLEQDDAIIGRVFAWSMVIVAVALAFVVGFLVLRWWQEREPEPAVLEAEIELGQLLEPSGLPEPPVARFVDITRAAGIDFIHFNGAYGDRMLPETMGGGVAFFDYNDDGRTDLLFVNGDRWSFAPESAAPRPNALRLYENDGAGHFREVTTEVGFDGVHFQGMGVAVGDYDGDGRVDVFATAVGGNRLFRNGVDGFVEVTDEARVAGEADRWSSSAAFFDADNDGDLDLYVVNYVQWSREIDLEVDYRLTGIGRAYGPPMNFAGTRDYFYRNDGEGRFEEVGSAAGLDVRNPATGEPVGKGLAVRPVDLDGDGWMDLVVANDTVQNFVFHNDGTGRFEEVGTEWGLGFDRNGMATGAMGVDAARHRNDQSTAVAIGNFANEMTSFYVSHGVLPQFVDQAIGEGLGSATRAALTFGVFFFDYELDGRLDFLQANGHVENEINQVQASQNYRQAAQLFWNCGADCPGTYQPVPGARTGDLSTPIVGRGAAYADIDADGDLDVVLTQVGGRPLLLRNDLDNGNHWLRIRLEGPEQNTGAIGARVRLQANGVSQYRTLMPARGYLSQVEMPLTFGLGEVDHVERIDIVWPGGVEQTMSDIGVDRLLIVRHPARGD